MAESLLSAALMRERETSATLAKHSQILDDHIDDRSIRNGLVMLADWCTGWLMYPGVVRGQAAAIQQYSSQTQAVQINRLYGNTTRMSCTFATVKN